MKYQFAAAVVLVLSSLSSGAIDIHQTGSTGGGTQSVAMISNPISGTMVAIIPRFNGALGTLVQADFEFAASTTGSWISTPPTGNDSVSISGPVDVSGQPMGNLSMGFSGTLNNMTPSNDFDAQSVFLTLNSGAFFNTLTGAGNLTLSYNYSGTTAVDVPATGTLGFDWGGSAHVLYTYEPVPEPGSVGLLGVVGVMSFGRRMGARRQRALISCAARGCGR